MSIDQMHLISKLYKLRRDIISDGYDEAINEISKSFPIKIHQYYSGTKCWTWTIPKKWTCEEAYIETLDGKRIIDQSNDYLYVASYSTAINMIISKEELLKHLHMHPYLEDVPPFIFYYYKEDWGFGCTKEVINSLKDQQYRVVIKSKKEDGILKVGDYFIKGEIEECFVLCAHLCHPLQVNDGLSGVVTGLAIMEELSKNKRLRYSYRLLIVPETIGSIAWLSSNEEYIPKIFGGLFLEMTGLRNPPALQLSYYGDTEIDKCLKYIHLLTEKAWCAEYRGIVGNDERQFNAPGVRIPMLSYSRALPWENKCRPFKEYHSSKDNLDITSQEMLKGSKQEILEMIYALENNYYPINKFKGEVFLSGYGIAVDRHRNLLIHRNMLKIIDMIDGTNSVVDIAQRLEIPFNEVVDFMGKLYSAGLIEKKYLYQN